MNEFILQFVLFLSLGAVVFMIARAIPRLDENGSEHKLVRGFFSKLPIHKYDAAIANLLEKNLRKLRVVLLRVDNSVINYMSRIKTNSSGNGNGNGHPKEFFGKEPTGEEEKTTIV